MRGYDESARGELVPLRSNNDEGFVEMLLTCDFDGSDEFFANEAGRSKGRGTNFEPVALAAEHGDFCPDGESSQGGSREIWVSAERGRVLDLEFFNVCFYGPLRGGHSHARSSRLRRLHRLTGRHIASGARQAGFLARFCQRLLPMNKRGDIHAFVHE